MEANGDDSLGNVTCYYSFAQDAVCVLYSWLQFDPPMRARERSPLCCQPHKNIGKQSKLSQWHRWNWQLLARQGWLIASGTLVPLTPSPVPHFCCLLYDSQGVIDTCKRVTSMKRLCFSPLEKLIYKHGHANHDNSCFLSYIKSS